MLVRHHQLHPLLRALPPPSCVSTCPCPCCIHFCKPCPPSCVSTCPCACCIHFCEPCPLSCVSTCPCACCIHFCEPCPPSCVSTCPCACCIHFCEPCHQVVSARAHAHVASTSASPATKLCQHVPRRMLHPLLQALPPSCVSTCPGACCIHFCEPCPPSCVSTCPGACCIHFCEPCHQVVSARAHAHVASTSVSPAH